MHIGMPEHPLHLIADIGGTHARFALCTSVRDINKISVLAVADFPTIELAIFHYLNTTGAPLVKHAIIAIANPVLGDHVKMTNFPWQFSINATRKALGFEKLHVINDFTALAMALPHIPPNELLAVGGDRAVPGTPLGLLGPGTGLGVSALIPTPKGTWVPLAAEGGGPPADTTTPVGNESVRGPVSVAAELFGLLRVMVRVDTPPAAIVAGLNDFTTVGGIVGTAHADMETVLESIVTAPLRARALPDIVALVSREMLVKARIFPMKAVPVPSVAELPTCQ